MKKLERNIYLNKLYKKAVREVEKYDRISLSFLQRKFVIPYKDAEKLMDILEDNKVVGPSTGKYVPRDVLHSRIKE